MRKRFISALLLIAGTALQAPAVSVNTEYSFTELIPSEGYPSHINCIYVGGSDHVWIGSSDGLYSMVNNSTITHYTNTGTGVSMALPSNDIQKVFVDQEGILWVFTDAGLVGYKNIGSPDKDPQRILSGEGVLAYSYIEYGGKVFFGGTDRIWEYNHATGEFTQTCFEENEGFSIDGLLPYSPGTVILFNKSGRKAKLFHIGSHTTEDCEYESDPKYFTAFAGSNGLLWVSKFNEGIVCIDPHGKVIARYNHEESGLSNNNVTCFTEKDGKIWAGTDGGGINVIDPVTGEVEILANIPSRKVTFLTCDKNGNVWAGRDNGGLFVAVKPQIKYYSSKEYRNFFREDGISALYQDSYDKTIWIGTRTFGLKSYDPETETFRQYPSTLGLNIFAISEMDGNYLVLSCPQKGFLVFNKHTGEISRSKYATDIENYLILNGDGSYICNDDHGRLIALTDKLIRFDVNTGCFEQFDIDPDVDWEHLEAVFGSRCGYLNDKHSLYSWDESKPTKLNRIWDIDENQAITCTALGTNEDIWAGAGDKLFRYSLRDGTADLLDLSFDSGITTLLCDKVGRLWIGTMNDLYCLNTVSGNFIKMCKVDGIRENEYCRHARLLAESGDIYFGGRTGLARVSSDIRFPIEKDPEIIVDYVLVDDIYYQSFHNLTIDPDHTFITIACFAKCDDQLHSRRYRINVSGLKHSLKFETTDPSLRFRTLSPGKYTIYISATTTDGRWTKSDNVFTFRVHRHWYGKWWFFVLVSLLALTFGFIGLKMFIRNKQYKFEQTADDERFNFLINISHELRTPLTLILGPLDRVLRKSQIPESEKKTLTNVYNQAERMRSLLNTILTTSKIQAGAHDINLADTEFNQWAIDCAEMFRDEARLHQMDILFKPDSEAGRIDMDNDICHIVFSNIMMNAIKHNEPGMPITVRTEADQAKNVLRLLIRDHGTGINEVDVSKLFRRFYQRTEDKTGFGIGLTYAKVLIEAMGGHIGGYNNIGDKGATFWFELPAKPQSFVAGDDGKSE